MNAMNYQNAYAAAKRAARKSKDWRYIVREPDGYGEFCYYVATDWDLETFFAGQPVELAIGPDGDVE